MCFGQPFCLSYFIVYSFTLSIFSPALLTPAAWPLHMFHMHLCKLIKLTKYCFLIMHRAEYWPHFHRDLTNAQIDEQFYNCIYAISLYFQSATNKKNGRGVHKVLSSRWVAPAIYAHIAQKIWKHACRGLMNNSGHHPVRSSQFSVLSSPVPSCQPDHFNVSAPLYSYKSFCQPEIKQLAACSPGQTESGGGENGVPLEFHFWSQSFCIASVSFTF